LRVASPKFGSGLSYLVKLSGELYEPVHSLVYTEENYCFDSVFAYQSRSKSNSNVKELNNTEIKDLFENLLYD